MSFLDFEKSFIFLAWSWREKRAHHADMQMRDLLAPFKGIFPHYHRMPILSIVVGAGSSQKRVKLLTKMRVVVLLLRSSLLLFSTVRTKKVEEVVSRPWKIPHPLSTAIKQGCQKLRAAAFATLKATAIHQSYIKAVPKGGRFVVCKCKKPRVILLVEDVFTEESIISLVRYRRHVIS